MKSGLVAWGALVWAAPALAQKRRSARRQFRPSPANPAACSIRASTHGHRNPRTGACFPLQPSRCRRDWRGVFDAIDAGNWASAQAGIAALPRGVLTPVAKAELYTAKGSPQVDLASIQALLAEAPELPEADQLARLAIARGATEAAADRAGAAGRQPRLASGPLSRQAGPGRARRRSASRPH